MKRDLDLMRNILLSIEGSMATTFRDSDFRSLEADRDVLIYNLEQLLAEGCIKGVPLGGLQGARTIRIANIKITPRGYEYLDAVRDNTIWHNVKEKFALTLATVTLETIKAFACGIGQGLASGGKH